MDVVAWVATGLLGVILLPAGLMKLTLPRAALAEKGLKWVEAFPAVVIRGIGGLEVAAVLGLVLPPLFDVATALSVAAAAGVVALMVGAAVTHVRRYELTLVAVNVVVAALAGLVIWGRTA